ncbi:MAG: alpha/beta hydrolase [Burkholderiales bacterium]|nr:alpha/beta hydrolase [Burkholderiales bacterium]
MKPLFMPPKSRPRGGLWYRLALTLLAVVLVAAVVFMAGPRNTLGTNAPTLRPLPPQTIATLDGWLQHSEAAFTDIKPGNAKGIVWNAPDHQRTPWSVVYLHGFSASRLETAPLAELVAKALGANVFYTRLSGHGRAGAAMGEATAQDWMADALEAVLIGQTLGERVLVISCSTGSTLATWLATSPEARRVAAHAFVSPNFGPKDKKAELINGHWGKTIALALEGETRGWAPQDAREANAWTSSYPTRALFPMMALVKAVRESDLSTFQTPLLVLYSEQDQTVDPLETQSAFTRIGAPLKTIEAVTYSKSRGQHVLAGDIRAPEATLPMAHTITEWVQALPRQGN